MFNDVSTIQLGPVFWATLLAGLAMIYYWLRAYKGSSFGSIRVESDERRRRPRQEREEEEHVLPSPEVVAIVAAMILFVTLAAAGLIR